MIKSEITSPPLLQRIDELLVGNHPHLQESNEIYYLSEYTSGKYADYSATNKLVLNYKKDPKWKGTKSWNYKDPAIRHVADQFRKSILQTTGFPERIKDALLVPVPPHAIKGDPEHDDRNLIMLHYFMPHGKIHELVLQKKSLEPSHKSKKKRDPKELEENYFLNMPNSDVKFNEVWLFDDVLRDGTHFRAIHNILTHTFPDVKIVGFFIARSIQPPESYPFASPLPF